MKYRFLLGYFVSNWLIQIIWIILRHSVNRFAWLQPKDPRKLKTHKQKVDFLAQSELVSVEQKSKSRQEQSNRTLEENHEKKRIKSFFLYKHSKNTKTPTSCQRMQTEIKPVDIVCVCVCVCICKVSRTRWEWKLNHTNKIHINHNQNK